MRCVADIHYKVIRKSTVRYWQEPNDFGEIKSLDCMFCKFTVKARRTSKPKSSKSGLGRYNRMRGRMVKHLHKEHRGELEKYAEPMMCAFLGGVVSNKGVAHETVQHA